MTKDLAILIGGAQKWEITGQFLDTLDRELKRRMGQVFLRTIRRRIFMKL